MLLTYDNASLVLQPTVLLENTFSVDEFTQNINVTLERVPYDDVKGNGTITGFTYEEISAGVQIPIMCAVRLVDSNDNSVVYREVYSSLDDGSYTFTGIKNRESFGQSYDIIAKPTTANYFKKIIEGINPLDDSVDFELLGVNRVSHVYQNKVSFITFSYDSSYFIPDLQVVCNRPVEVDLFSKTITIMYSSNIVGNTLQDITFISNSLEFVRSYQLPFNVIETTLGYYLFDGNTNNEYGSDALTVNGTPQYRDNAFIFDGNTKLQSNSSRFLVPNNRNQFIVSFKFCLYSLNDAVQVNQLFSTTETARNGGSLYVFVATNNTSNDVNNRGKLRINWNTGDGQVVSQHTPIVQPLTEHVVTLVYEADRLMLCLDGYVLQNLLISALAINNGFVLGGSNVTSGFVTQSSINGYISDFEYTRGLITTHNSLENRPSYADFPNFTLYGGSLVDDKKRLWQAYGTMTYDTNNQTTTFGDVENDYVEISPTLGECDYGTGDFTIEFGFSTGNMLASMVKFGSYFSSGGLQVRFNTFDCKLRVSGNEYAFNGNFVGQTNTRYDVVVTRSGTTFSLYVNGIVVGVLTGVSVGGSVVDGSANKPVFVQGISVLHYYRVIKGVPYNNGRL